MGYYVIVQYRRVAPELSRYEQPTHNRTVQGSIPCGATKPYQESNVGKLKKEHRAISKLAALTRAQVRQIRSLSEKGMSQNALAEKFHVSQASIHNILVGKTYRGVI